MGQILLATLILATVISTLARPWIGIIAYYLLALLGPQYIWWWNFEGLRVSFWVAIFTLVGIAIKIVLGEYDLSFLKTKQNLWIFLLWLFIAISYFLGPYVSLSKARGFRTDQLFTQTNNIFLFYFCATLAINNFKRLRYLSIIFVITTVYLIFWANNQYFTSNWDQFNMGRLMGPTSVNGGTIYGDENAFAMLFVTGLPFVYYLGFEIKNKILRYALWSTIPLGWHAIFLTGSRGGLLGLGAITLLVALKSRRKLLALPLILVFLAFYQWQAGDVMKQRSEQITDYEGESSAETRVTAWKGGLKMIQAHPLSGIGLGSFEIALQDYIESKPMVAHNTFIQFAAESGIGAGLCYLLIIYNFFMGTRRVNSWCSEPEEQTDARQIQLINNASTVSFTGLILCSLFLSLNTYEIFLYLLIIGNTMTKLYSSSKEQAMPVILLNKPQSAIIESSFK